MAEIVLPEVEQPILVLRDIDLLPGYSFALLDGVHAGIVVRRGRFDSFEDDILHPLEKLHGLEEVETQGFNRRKISLRPTEAPTREMLHMDVTLEGNYEYTLTAIEVINGGAIFAAAQASSRVRGWSPNQYESQKKRLNDLPRVRSLFDKVPGPAFNVMHELPHKGLRGPLGAVAVEGGDAVLIAQGGEGSASPSWHSLITTDAPRISTSHHLAKVSTPSPPL